MLLVIAKHNIRKDKVDYFIHLINPLIKETNQSHEGCIRYELFQDMENPNSLTMVEEWEDQAALDKHMETTTFKKILPELEKCLEKPVEITKYRNGL